MSSFRNIECWTFVPLLVFFFLAFHCLTRQSLLMGFWNDREDICHMLYLLVELFDMDLWSWPHGRFHVSSWTRPWIGFYCYGVQMMWTLILSCDFLSTVWATCDWVDLHGREVPWPQSQWSRAKWKEPSKTKHIKTVSCVRLVTWTGGLAEEETSLCSSGTFVISQRIWIHKCCLRLFGSYSSHSFASLLHCQEASVYVFVLVG